MNKYKKEKKILVTVANNFSIHILVYIVSIRIVIFKYIFNNFNLLYFFSNSTTEYNTAWIFVNTVGQQLLLVNKLFYLFVTFAMVKLAKKKKKKNFPARKFLWGYYDLSTKWNQFTYTTNHTAISFNIRRWLP